MTGAGAMPPGSPTASVAATSPIDPSGLAGTLASGTHGPSMQIPSLSSADGLPQDPRFAGTVVCAGMACGVAP